MTPVDDRILRRDEDRAAGGVLAHERALRAAQDFHARNVVVRLRGEVTRKGRHAIAVGDHARGGLRVVLGLADATDVEVDALAEVVHRRRRRDELQLVDRGDAAGGDVFTGHDRRRDGRRLQTRAPPLGGDDDLAEFLGSCFGGFFGWRLARGGQGCRDLRHGEYRREKYLLHALFPSSHRAQVPMRCAE